MAEDSKRYTNLEKRIRKVEESGAHNNDIPQLKQDSQDIRLSVRDIQTNMRWYWRTVGAIVLLAASGFGYLLHNLDQTSEKVFTLDGQIKALTKQVGGAELSSRLVALSQKPITAQSRSQVTKIVQKAIETGDELNPEALSSVGTRLVSASRGDLSNWPITLTLLKLRSEKEPIPLHFERLKPPSESFSSKLIPPPGFDGRVAVGGQVAGNTGAEILPIGAPSPNTSAEFGVGYFLLLGGTVRLDGMRMKNVIIKDSKVIYAGGPASLTDVHFINCTFDLLPKKNQLDLADEIFSGGGITIRLG